MITHLLWKYDCISNDEGKYGVYVLNEEDYTGYGGDPEHIKQTAQGLADYLVKGQKVAISGRLRQDRWQSQEGENRSKVVIIVNEIEIVTPKKQDNEADNIPW